MSTLNEVHNNIVQQIERDLTHLSSLELKSMMASGLAEEAGEVNGLYKRELRNFPKDKPRCTTEHFQEELGDVLWYLVGVAHTHGLTLQDIWDYNVKKLEARYGK